MRRERVSSILEVVNYKGIALLAMCGSGLFILTGQQPAPSAIFTSAQAEAGRAIYARTCAKCHTETLLGRQGMGRKGLGPRGSGEGELPPGSTLSAPYQKFIGTRGFVPPLAGKDFIERWGEKTAAGLIARFQETVSDPFFEFEDMAGEATVNLTAYVLEVNGAKAGTQPLTRKTDVIVRSVTR